MRFRPTAVACVRLAAPLIQQLPGYYPGHQAARSEAAVSTSFHHPIVARTSTRLLR